LFGLAGFDHANGIPAGDLFSGPLAAFRTDSALDIDPMSDTDLSRLAGELARVYRSGPTALRVFDLCDGVVDVRTFREKALTSVSRRVKRDDTAEHGKLPRKQRIDDRAQLTP
jgi:hypothetical protein